MHDDIQLVLRAIADAGKYPERPRWWWSRYGDLRSIAAKLGGNIADDYKQHWDVVYKEIRRQRQQRLKSL